MPLDAPYLNKWVGEFTGKRVYNVHRLDAKTSGIILLAFSSEAARALTLRFERKEVKKSYVAIVLGQPPETGIFDEKVVVKKKSRLKKEAITRFHTQQTIFTGIPHKTYDNTPLSLVEIFPETGRWHQIRQHFARHRFDIVGDGHHGDFSWNKKITEMTGYKRLFLHAREIELQHPVENRPLKLTVPVPEAFPALLSSF